MSEYVFILLFHIIISRLIFLSILHNNNRSILYTLRKYKNSMHLTKCVIIYIYTTLLGNSLAELSFTKFIFCFHVWGILLSDHVFQD